LIAIIAAEHGCDVVSVEKAFQTQCLSFRNAFSFCDQKARYRHVSRVDLIRQTPKFPRKLVDAVGMANQPDLRKVSFARVSHGR
jgi:hypothetical protein